MTEFTRRRSEGCVALALAMTLVVRTLSARQMVPEVPPTSDAVQKALAAEWLTDDERKDLRVFHGVWDERDLDSPRRAAEAALLTWRFDAPALQDPTVPAAWRAEALVRRGRFAEALAIVENDSSPGGVAVRAECLAWLGRNDKALAATQSLDALLDVATSAEDITAAARAAALRGRLEARETSDWQRTLDALGRARNEFDRMHWPSLLVEGSLLAEKHHESLAIPALNQAILLQPRSSEAWFALGMLAADRFAFEEVDRAMRALRRIRTGHPLAGVLEAQMSLMRRDPDLAQAALDRVLAAEPTMPEALALRAAADAVRHDGDGARRWLAKLEAIAPGAALGPFTVGRFLSENRQYDEAAEQLEEAIRRAPQWSDPRIALGLLETQTGRDDKSRAALTEATRLDPFNKRAQNSLFLLEEMKDWVRFEGKHFVVRCKPGEDEIIAAMMPAELDAMHEIVAGRFRHEPDQKTAIDLMPDHQSFAVRITGMPQLHTIAACTGPVIAIEVPKRGPSNRHLGLFDWLKVLRHEYTHTVTLSQTRNRIPHWLTEAAAVSMELTPRDWPTCQLLARELEQGTLFDLESINWGFVRPIRPQDRQLAYAQGHWMVEYMNERYGMDALVTLLGLYHDGVPEAKAMPQAIGVSPEAFHRSFLAWAREQVRSWGLAPVPGMDDLIAEARSRDPEAQAHYVEANAAALELTAQRLAEQIGEPGDSKTERLTGAEWPRVRTQATEIDDGQIGRWLHDYPTHPDVLELALRRSLKRLGDSPIDPLTLELVDRYSRARPVDPFPHRLLAKRELGSDDPTRAIPHLVELDLREEHDNAFAIELAKLYRTKGQLSQSRDSAERAVRMDPYDPAIRELAAAIAVEQGNYRDARGHIAALQLLEPDQPRHKARLAKLDELIAR